MAQIPVLPMPFPHFPLHTFQSCSRMGSRGLKFSLSRVQYVLPSRCVYYEFSTSTASGIGHLQFTFSTTPGSTPYAFTSTPSNVTYPLGAVHNHFHPSTSAHEMCGWNAERQDYFSTPTSTSVTVKTFKGYDYCMRFDYSTMLVPSTSCMHSTYSLPTTFLSFFIHGHLIVPLRATRVARVLLVLLIPGLKSHSVRSLKNSRDRSAHTTISAIWDW